MWIWWWFTCFTPICNSTVWRHIFMDHVSYVSCSVSIHVILLRQYHKSSYIYPPLHPLAVCLVHSTSSLIYISVLTSTPSWWWQFYANTKKTNHSNQIKLQQVSLSQFCSMFSQFGNLQWLCCDICDICLLLATRCVLYPTLEHYVLEPTRAASVHELRQNTDEYVSLNKYP